MRPVIAHIGPLSIHSWGTMLVVALAVGAWLVGREMKKEGRDPWQAFDLALWAGISGLVCSRIVYILINLPSYLTRPMDILTEHYGLSWHGALLGGFIAGYLYVRRIKLPIGRAADMAAPAVCLGYSIARVGCFLAGCCHGIPTNLPWGFVFYDVPRHPTQLYASLLNLLVFAALMLLRDRPRPFAGSLWLYYLGLYSIQRFIVEFWREGVHIWGWLSLGQAVSIAIAVVSFAALWYLGRRLPAGASAADDTVS